MRSSSRIKPSGKASSPRPPRPWTTYLRPWWREPRLREARSVERSCLAFLLRHPELKGQADALSAEYFREGQHREVLRLWKEDPDPQALAQRLDPALPGHLEGLLAQPAPPD